MTPAEQKNAAAAFVAYWTGKGYEKGETQTFWLQLLHDVVGVSNPFAAIRFEGQVQLGSTKFFDAYIPATRVLIEQKSVGKDLREGSRQGDGTVLTPFEQARRYVLDLPVSMHPRWIVTCNFREFLVYDMENPAGEPESIQLTDLPRKAPQLAFLADPAAAEAAHEKEVSFQAGELVGRIYDAFLGQYSDPENPESLKSLNALCVRIVFCLYAEDAGVFADNQFHDYLKEFPASHARRALIDLFAVLDTAPQERDRYLEPALAAFPHVGGGLFGGTIEIPPLTDEILDLLLRRASEAFNWAEISPAIFGAVFESTLNPETRRKGGMHYTSIENIHKVIDPLFLDGLRAELADLRVRPENAARDKALLAFQTKLAGLTFLDPACGSGNFLTESFRSLRRLENEALSLRFHGQMHLDLGDAIQVRIEQFRGIEINDFAATVARTALWIAESQMMQETERILHSHFEFLPLRSYPGIVEANALHYDWKGLEHGKPFDYIMGNPPFVGARLMGEAQKADVDGIFQGWKNAGNLDYVSCWFKRAADYMAEMPTRSALVATNSISQGDSVAVLWRPLMEHGVEIDFVHRTFIWDSEAKTKAHVHCVIIGFHNGSFPTSGGKRIFDGESVSPAKHINAYLLDAPDTFVSSRSKPLCDVPEIGIGNKPIDGGNYLFTAEEKDAFLQKEPNAAKWFRPWLGSEEFINRHCRYCLWLGDCPPNELRDMPECMKRVQAVHDFRLASKSEGTRKIADRPTRFHVENMPSGNFILVPKVSSERRRYVPMGFLSPEILCSDLVFIIPEADIYHFGVLTSSVHMAWMRAVAGRLKSDYRYSKDIVYNNFPWPQEDPDAKAVIEKTAQGILDARAEFPEASLADLYDPLTMPPSLHKAHEANDAAVMKAYGFPRNWTEQEIVAALFRLYESLVASAPAQ